MANLFRLNVTFAQMRTVAKASSLPVDGVLSKDHQSTDVAHAKNRFYDNINAILLKSCPLN